MHFCFLALAPTAANIPSRKHSCYSNDLGIQEHGDPWPYFFSPDGPHVTIFLKELSQTQINTERQALLSLGVCVYPYNPLSSQIAS